MKLVIGLLAGIALVAIAWLVLGVAGAERLPTSSAEPSRALATPRPDGIARLEERIRDVEAALARLEAERARPAAEAREPVAFQGAAAPAEASPDDRDKSPSWYLDRYVDSFRTRDSGSEYFRLAVEAYAPALVPEISVIVRNSESHRVLRARLVEILGDPRFAGNDKVIDALIGVLLRADEETLAATALVSLGKVADARTAPVLERVVWSIAWKGVQLDALRLVVTLAGSDANTSILRLLGSGVDGSVRAFLVTLLNHDDLATALAVFQRIAGNDKPVRLQGAHKIGEYRREDFLAFVDSWIGFEPDTEVRSVLGEARQRQQEIPRWNALQAVGPPDADPAHDSPNAWAARQEDMGEQWLDVGFATPLRANAVRIFEVNVAGAVTRLVATDEAGRSHALWSGSDPTAVPGVFEVPFPTTSYRVRRVRIYLDTSRRPGWEEIDTVELVGPDGTAWASDASASSSYGV
jgi:hypothetical protein